MVDFSKKKILVVEDDPDSRDVIVEALQSYSFQVEIAENGEEALEKVRFWRPHLVLSDHDMPGMTGLEMLKRLRDQQNYVTVIFVSGRNELKVIVDTLNSGADDFIRKPFRYEELVARIRVSLRHNEAHRELLEANNKLQEMVDHDFLTGLYNMRSIYDKIDYEIRRSRRFERTLACVMIDMDHFKRVNDDHDHLFGSHVLKEMGGLIKRNIRDVDFAARYGGDEFLVVLSEVTDGGTEIFCERFRKMIEEHTFKHEKDAIQLTVSLGYSIWNPESQWDARELVRAADHALYRAKNSGRNRYSK